MGPRATAFALKNCSISPWQGASPYSTIERLLEELGDLLPRMDAALVGILDECGRLGVVCTSGALRNVTCTPLSLDRSLSGLALREGEILVCDDASRDPRVHGAVFEGAGMASVMSVPLLRDGAPYGVIVMLARQAHAFGAPEVAVCKALAGVLGMVVSVSLEAAKLCDAVEAARKGDDNGHGGLAESPDVTAQLVSRVFGSERSRLGNTRRRISRVLDEQDLDIFLQPVVELSSMKTVAFEALARFSSHPSLPPGKWFSDAAKLGLGTKLELLALRKALVLLELLPEPIALAVNLGPAAVCSRLVRDELEKYDPARLVIELTEHEAIADYGIFTKAIQPFRDGGGRLAVDDTGAGFSSLAHIAQLEPDLIKLDRWLVSDIASNRSKQALTSALLSIADNLGAQVVAEGVETAGELRTVMELGVQLGQGYYLGRPSPLPKSSSLEGQRCLVGVVLL
jgi:EAL domain-containing protein (putative c-di-GMP-specific phosphodiesterase class I)